MPLETMTGAVAVALATALATTEDLAVGEGRTD